MVVFNRDGFLGLEFEDFEAVIRPALHAVGEALEKPRTMAAPPALPSIADLVESPRPPAAGFSPADADLPTPADPVFPPPQPSGPLAVGAPGDHGVEPFAHSEDRQDRVPLERGATIPSPPPAMRAHGHPTGVEPDRSDSIDLPPIPRRRHPVSDGTLSWDLTEGPVSSTAAHHAPFARTDGPPTVTFGAEALARPNLSLPRASPAGVVTFADPVDLLGVYLSSLRHRTLTVVGGPAVAPGDPFELEIRAHRAVGLTVTAVARVGEWLTLVVDDPTPVETLVREAREGWCPAVTALGLAGATPSAIVNGPADPPLPRPPAAAPSSLRRPAPRPVLDPPLPEMPAPPVPGPLREARDLTPSPPAVLQLGPLEPPAPLEDAPIGSDAVADLDPVATSLRSADINTSTGDLVAAIVATPDPAAEGEAPVPAVEGQAPVLESDAPVVPAPPTPLVPSPPGDPSPPEASPEDPSTSPEPVAPPRLEDDLVIFDRRQDLAHEMATNLKNGGLFVESEPVAIRSKRRLRVRVGDDTLPVVLETDVVFADGGRVGLSIANTPAAQKDLQRYLDGELSLDTPSTGASQGPQTGGLNTLDVKNLNADAVASADVHTFAGTLAEAPSIAELLRLQETRVEDPAQLSRVGTLHLCEYAFRQQWKGVLTIKSDGQLRRVWMHEGSVAYIESEPYEDPTSLGRILVTQKKLTEVNLRDGLEKSKLSGRSLGRSLVVLGMVKRTDITGALREQVRLKMDACFGWSAGHYEWTPWTEPPGQADLVLTRGIGVMARHIRGRLEALSVAEVEQLFGRGLSRTIDHRPDVDQLATSLQLAPRDLRFLELQVDGTKTVGDAATGSALTRLASLRLLALGLGLGFVRYTDGPAPRASTPAPPAAAKAESRLTAKLQEKLKLVRSQNHFERLGVHWSAHHRTYRSAYDAEIAEVDLTKPPLRDAAEEAKTVARNIRVELDTAFKALTEAHTRSAYRKQLFDPTEREYASDMLVKQGEVALMRGDRVQAIECLETAVELSPTPRNRSLLKSARDGRG